MARIEEFEEVVGCTKHGPCDGCRIDDLEDEITSIKKALNDTIEKLVEVVNDKE